MVNIELHLYPLEMKFICLTLLIIIGISDSRSEQYEVVGPADPVFAVAGEDVILPCSVKPNISVVDMKVEWFRLDLKDSLVHLYEDHEDKNADQIQSYRGRTKLIHQELQKGNTSLKLSTVQVSDEGLYKCFIQSKSWYDDVTVNVSVEAVGSPPVITVDGFDHSGGLHLQCESKGWFPEPDLEWLDSEGVSLSSKTAEKHRETDRFSVKQTITVHHSDSKYHCRVKLRHHLLETLIITSSKMFHSWKTFVIWTSITAVLSVISGIAVILIFVKKHREYSKRLNKRKTMGNGLLKEQMRLQEDLQTEKMRTQNVTLSLQNEMRRMENDLLNEQMRMQEVTLHFKKEERRMENECFKLLQIQTTTVQNVLSHLRKLAVDVILDADTAHPRLIVSDDGKQVKLGNTKPTEEKTGNEEQNTQQKEEEIGEREQNAQLKEEKIGEREQNTQPKEQETGNEEQNTQPKEEKIGEREQNTQPKEQEIGEREQNTQPKEEEIGEREQNSHPKEEEIGEREQNAQPKEEEIGEREQNAQPKEEEIEEREQNTQHKEAEIEEREQNTQHKEAEIGEREQNAQLKEGEIGEREQNSHPKEEEIGEREQNTQQKEQENGEREQNAQPKEEEIGEREQNAQPKEEENGIKEQNHKFENYLGVLGKDGFSSGCFYFEVQVKGQTEWDLGVARESVNKKELFSLNPENRCWTVSHRNEMYQVFGSPFDSFVSSIKLEKVGVFVDYEEGLVSFYDVEAMSHIYSYVGQSFNEKIYPFFGLGLLWNKNTAPLIISPVKLKSKSTKK